MTREEALGYLAVARAERDRYIAYAAELEKRILAHKAAARAVERELDALEESLTHD